MNSRQIHSCHSRLVFAYPNIFPPIFLFYACTLNVLPLAVFLSFSSVSGLALRKTKYVSTGIPLGRYVLCLPCRKSAVRLRIRLWMYALLALM